MQQFDPVLIVYQIIAMQCFHYLALGTLLGLFHAVFDINVSLDHFFTSKYVTFWTPAGWMEILCLLGTSLIGYVIIFKFVDGFFSLQCCTI